MEPNQQVPQQIPQPVSPPWPYMTTLILSILFGFGAGYLIVWQNMKRIGKNQEDIQKFLLWGGLALLLLIFLVVIIPIKGLYFASLVYPVWFESKYFKTWKQQNPTVKPKFSWSLLGWAVLGMILTIVLAMFSYLVASGVGLIK